MRNHVKSTTRSIEISDESGALPGRRCTTKYIQSNAAVFVDLTETRLVYISQGVRPSFIRNLQEAMNLCTNTPDLMTCDIR